VALWSVQANDGLTRLDHGSWIYTLSLSADGQRAITGGWDQRVRVFEVATGKMLRDVAVGGENNPAALSPDGTWFVAPAEDQRLGIWSVADGARRYTLPGHRGSFTGLAITPDGAQVASAGRDDTVRLWSVPPSPVAGAPVSPDAPQHTLAVARVLNTPGVRVLGLVYSVDGKRLATGGNDHKVRVYDRHTGALLQTFAGHTDWVTGLSFSPDNQHIATSGKDRQVILWDAATGQEIRRFNGHGQWVNRTRFSPDGKHLATAGDDRLTVVWRVDTGEQVLRVLGDNGITDLRFTPDGKRLAIADGSVVTLRDLDLGTAEAVRPAPDRQREAEREAGRRLDGFELVVDETR
jgi:WD40 repeat protein